MSYHVPVQQFTTACLSRLAIGPSGSTKLYQDDRQADPAITFLQTKVSDEKQSLDEKPCKENKRYFHE